MRREKTGETEGDLVVEEARPALKKPPMYTVVLINDDYTPMDFVVEVLVRFFGMDETRAVEVMLQVHHQGKGICGVYTREIAEKKVDQVTGHARSHSYPLLCSMEVV